MKKIKISENSFEFNKKDIEEILTSNNWGKKYSKDNIYKHFSGSNYFAIATVGKKQVGYVRALSDGNTVTFLSEIIVHKDYQNNGIGKKLMKSFNKKYAHTSVYSFSFKEQVGFFEKFKINQKDNLIPCSRVSL